MDKQYGMQWHCVMGEGWEARLTRVAEAMREANARVLDDDADRAEADTFVKDRIQGARTSLLNLRRLCSLFK